VGQRDDDLQGQQVLSLGILSGGLLVLVLGALVRPLHPTPAHGLDSLSLGAAALGVLAPLCVLVLRLSWRRGMEKTLHLVTFALLDGSVVLCGLALMMNDRRWPLAAALVPLGAMAFWFPRKGTP